MESTIDPRLCFAKNSRDRARGGSPLASLSICLVALLIEAAMGYPSALFARLGHPVTWIGGLIVRLDKGFNRETAAFSTRRQNGVLALAIILAASCGIAMAAQALAFAAMPAFVALFAVGLLASSCLAQRSLFAHVRAVEEALRADGVIGGRGAVSLIVGRDTATLDEADVARAAIESLAENFADGIVAPALWLAALGLPGGVTYKAINTADSMIGHRTPRHEAFGFAAAKLDDLINWPAARLAGLWIVLAAAMMPGTSGREAWRIMRRDARGHASPNAGWPEAAMAGALGIKLGGPRVYAGRVVADGGMGDGTSAIDGLTIRKALRLYQVACGINIGAVAATTLLIA